jgi:hypothetical protein
MKDIVLSIIDNCNKSPMKTRPDDIQNDIFHTHGHPIHQVSKKPVKDAGGHLRTRVTGCSERSVA